MATRLAGAFAALILGIILLQFGFEEALFLLACMAIGWWIAATYLGETSISEWLDRHFQPRGRRR